MRCGGAALHVCVEEGAWPSGEVMAADSQPPNPLYSLGGLRCMCNRRLVGHRVL